MSTASDKKVELVRQMLAKAESTTPEEAKALTEAALKIMQRLGIDEAMLDVNRAQQAGKPLSKQDIASRTIFLKGIYARSLVSMAHAVTLATPCRLLVTRDVRRAEGIGDLVTLYGFPNDLDAIVALIESLQVQVKPAVKKFFTTKFDRWERDCMTEMEAYKVRREFIVGYGVGYAQKMREDTQAAIVETEKESGFTGTALVLVNRAALVAEVAEERSSGRSGRGFTASSDHGGYRAGVSAGRDAYSGKRAIK